MESNHRLKAIALLESQRATLVGKDLNLVYDPYLSEYQTILADLQKHTDDDLTNFLIHPSQIAQAKSSPARSYCDHAYFLSKLNAVISYLRSLTK